ncbi:MAG TPA: MBL fold metallo-hydrolase [Candidatus Limnocylindrales bacterium]|nr:MBL fold metallo-hydrolase [Candidatus Limnocylindrales bacterium]
MDIQYYGANCLVFSTKGVRVVVDDNLADLGAKSVTKPGDITLFTSAHGLPKVETKLTIDSAGEYEVSDVSVYGVPVRAHMDEEGKLTGTMYKIHTRELNIFVAGHMYPELTDDELEAIGMVDVMFVPVGGNGYTLDPVGALKVIRKIEPKVIVPTHYDLPGINYPVPQQTLQQALTGLSMEPKDTVQKLKLKTSELGDITELVVLEKL